MLKGMFARMRSLGRGARQGEALRDEMTEEFRHHMELRAADLERGGLPPAEAARQARLEFGSAERYHDQGRRSRGLHRVDQLRFSWLDLKLGFRMLAKYPGITLVGGAAMAFAIWIGAGTFELVKQVLSPTLPLPAGHRIVGINLWDVAANKREDQLAHDFVAWRDGLRSVTDLGAFRILQRNLITADGRGEPVEIAEITAAASRATRVSALVGRALTADDERPGAPSVAVIGHELWQSRFAGDRGVVGREVRLGSTPTTIVGVMPPGYAFPSAQNVWTPLRLNVLDFPRRAGPELRVFGRLADGASFADAQAELTLFASRAAAAYRDTHEHLRPQVMPFAKSLVNLNGLMKLGVGMANLPVLLLLALICANVALLLFARAATRETEIVVRTALGATRGRIVMQLFAEALVLGAVAAVIGLAGAGAGVRWAIGIIEGEFMDGGRLPFWFQGRLSTTTVLYAAGLTVFCAVIAGVMPALKVTRGIGARLKEATAGGGGLRFGGVWTAVIVTQVAITVAFPIFTIASQQDAVQIRAMQTGFPANEYLSLRLELDRDLDGASAGADTSRAARLAHFRRTALELERRLRAEPTVGAVAFADRLPRTYHPHRLVDVDAGGAAPLNPQYPAYRVSGASVGPGFFDAVQARILSGRGFTPADHEVDRGDPAKVETARGGPVIVNQSFVKLVLGGRNPIGRRIKYRLFEEWYPRTLRDDGPWYEIVGVVRDMAMASGNDPKVAGIYHPIAAGAVYPARLAVHVRGDPAAFAPRLRGLAAEVDPALRLYEVQRLDRVNDAELEFIQFWFRLLLGGTAMAVTLSLAGIYAVMSFTVARRTREIGIRVALGASPRRIVTSIFRRPFFQVTLGVVVGGVLMATLIYGLSDGPVSLKWVGFVAADALCVMLVCLLACVVPALRALRVQPTEALRSEG